MIAMKKKLKLLLARIFVLLVLACVWASCVTTGKNSSSATLTETPARMFWRIDGTDKNGNPSTVYVQGTFHVGDDRLYPLDSMVVEAWGAADRLMAEISDEDYAALPVKVNGMMMESYQKAGGRHVEDALSSTQKATLHSYIDEELMERFGIFEPWVTTYSLANAIYEGTGLSAEYGLDNMFLTSAMQSDRKVDGLDDLQVQLDVMTYGNYEVQLDMLRDLLDDLADPTEEEADIKALYEAYIDDEKKAVDLLNDSSMEEDIDRHDFYEGYYKLLMSERNEDWAKDITACLREGGTTFIFAGAAHWVGKDSVFSYLKKMGTID